MDLTSTNLEMWQKELWVTISKLRNWRKLLETGMKKQELFSATQILREINFCLFIPRHHFSNVAKTPEDITPAMCPKFYHNPNRHCARTHGHDVRKISNKGTRYPHRIIMENQKKLQTSPKKPQEITIPDEDEETTDFGKITSVTSLKQVIKPSKPKTPGTTIIDDFKDFKLVDKPKGSFMFVNWTIVR